MVIAALLIEVLMILLRYDQLWTWYTDLREMLMNLEVKITNLDRSFEFVLVILLLYFIKAFFPIYTTSTVCLLTGIVLPLYMAIPINIIGIGLQFTIKYFWGQHFGAGYAWKLLMKNDSLKSAIQSDGSSNPALLFAIRLVPVVPINLVSAVYGSFSFGYKKFLIVSLLGFMPRLISFTVAGTNMFDPLSVGFLLPVMLICLLTGITLLSANGVWNLVDRFVKFYNRRSEKRKKKEQTSEVNTKDKEDETQESKAEEITESAENGEPPSAEENDPEAVPDIPEET